MAIVDKVSLHLKGAAGIGAGIYIPYRGILDVDGRPIGKVDQSTNAAIGIDYPHHEVHSGSHFYIEGSVTLLAEAVLYVKLVTADSAKYAHFTWEIDATGVVETTFDEDATGGMAGGAVATIHANNRNTFCWTGMAEGAQSETVLTDSNQAWATNELVGFQVFNTTDGSSGIIVSNTATTATVAALAGGTDNDWDANDTYEINKSMMVITSGVTACTGFTQQLSDQTFGAAATPSKITGGGSARDNEIMLKADTVYCRGFIAGTDTSINFRASWYEHTDAG